ncbi:hypothetical protein C1D09_027190 [Mesorhizobium intechi]|nr:hypothetical protein C1D09_027190 [Mesorhizobium intechi]
MAEKKPGGHVTLAVSRLDGAAFLLHDVFGVGFDEVAAWLRTHGSKRVASVSSTDCRGSSPWKPMANSRPGQASPNSSTARMMPRNSARPFSRPISE